ncbi:MULTISPECIES: hypothetical protein [Saccharothrix]|uniref:hypothetical protein n=1 Tax=Saccharothrix TaxID=2071 RepID=UPI0011610F46|nr:hypothetical protein [Saccharothrix sp. CB00851]
MSRRKGEPAEALDDIPSEGETRWVRLYGVARQVKVGPLDKRLAAQLGGTVSAMELNTGVWRNYSLEDLKATREELPADCPLSEPIREDRTPAALAKDAARTRRP